MQEKDPFDVDINSCSTMDCTGLIPSLPQSADELESYSSIYHYGTPNDSDDGPERGSEAYDLNSGMDIVCPGTDSASKEFPKEFPARDRYH